MAATGYVSTTGDARKVSKTGDTMTGELVLPDSAPDAALAAASKGYVDGIAAAKVTKPESSTDNAVARFDGTTGLIIQNSTVIIGDDGSVTITGHLTDAGDFVVRDSNTTATKGYRFRTSGGALDCESGGADWFFSSFPNADFSGTQNNYLRMEAGAATLHVTAEVRFDATAFGSRVHTLNGVANTVGFHGAGPVARQTITGSRTDGTALASLLTALETRGDFIDGSSA